MDAITEAIYGSMAGVFVVGSAAFVLLALEGSSFGWTVAVMSFIWGVILLREADRARKRQGR